MNNKKLISLAIFCIFAAVTRLPVLSFAGDESEVNTKAEQHFEKANELRKVADHDAAITEYEKAISLSPKSKIAQNAQYWIGQSHFQAGRLEFQKLIDEHPSSTIAPSTKQMMERVQQTKKDKSLIEAAEKGDVEQLELLISRGANVNVKDQKGMTPLHLAAKEGHEDIAEILISKGANINAIYGEWGVPLHLAAREGHAEVAELLIDKGTDVNAHGPYGHTSLQYATNHGHVNVIELLISKGADIEARDNWDTTPLIAAARWNHPELVKLLLDRGANIEARTTSGETTLMAAAGANNPEAVKLLLDRGADIEARSSRGYTPLIAAARANSLEAAKLLLKRGALIDGKPYGDKTALREAVKNGHKDMVELLLAHGAAPGRRYLGQNLIMVAMYSHHKVGNQKEMVKLLVDKGVRHSPVHIAAFMGDLDEVKSYLAAGGDINAQDPSHQLTLLMCAFYGGQTEEMEFLISKGADINLQDGEGNTVLHRCPSRGRLGLEHARMLLDKGADVTIRNDIGATPLNWGIPFYDVEHLKMLIAKGADVNTRHGPWLRAGIKNQGDEGWTPLHVVCMDAGRAGTEAKAEVLIAHGADVNAKTKKGKTPMSLAKERGDEQIVELLRKHGAKE